MDDLADKVVLVTGAGRGIGRAVALAFAAAGARVAVNDLTPINLDVTVAQITGAGGLVKDYIFDVAKKMPVQEMVDQVLADLGRIDILVNSAGVHPQALLLEMDEWDWRRTLDVNLGGPFFTTQLAGRAMRQQGGGVIINIAAAFDRAASLEDSAAFVASKTGLVGLTRQAARELAGYNIRVNAICSGQPEAVADLALFLCRAEAAHLTGQVFNPDGSLVL